ncbi:DNA adenine methylase [Mesorhizobium sp. M0309]|uniref:DNA adenine methylase n=1 Tax=unclassified Mesorhizobium TaxID=325217 RepID=UPI0018DD4DF4|nr:DNA adenine methylase [Mesorhizobium sp. LSHC414A00]
MRRREAGSKEVSRSASPLRYPGGKACLFDLATAFLSVNGLNQRSYAEPYSGGCGLALSLLFSGHVSQVHLNDLDRSVWAFWKSVLDHTEELTQRIMETPVTVDEWGRQRLHQSNKSSADAVDLGFSTFFLNRTNRSGIIHSGGIIGGKNQAGAWKLDCRFNKPDLVARIQRIQRYRNRIHIYNEDAEHFMERLGQSIPSTSVLYIDPPYFEKGSQLYKNSYRAKDHQRIASRLTSLSSPWFLTYDNVPEIRDLYRGFESVELDIGYSVQTKRRGSELMVVSPGVSLPVSELAYAH